MSIVLGFLSTLIGYCLLMRRVNYMYMLRRSGQLRSTRCCEGQLRVGYYLRLTLLRFRVIILVGYSTKM